MSGRKLPTTSKSLIDTLTSSSALPVVVPRLDSQVLKHLIDTIGLEDAGALVEHASPSQIAHLLDETIWSGARPGDPERLSIAELLRWFDLWRSVGESFVAGKLFQLGEDFCALTFSRLINVSATDLSSRVLDEFSQALGAYVVRVSVDDEWDTVRDALNALWTEYPDFLEAMLERLCFRHSILRMYGEDDIARVLTADATHQRDTAREEKGYVTSAMAGVFLTTVTSMDLEVLVAEEGYDPVSAEYFARRKRTFEQDTPSPIVNDEQHQDPEDTEPMVASLNRDASSLERAIEQFEYQRNESRALLEGPSSGTRTQESILRQILAALHEDSAVFDARTSELSYLANLLLAGASRENRRLSEPEAASLAMATCNLGCNFLMGRNGADFQARQSMEADMRRVPGLLRLFRIGWRVLATIPLRVAERVTQTFAATDVRNRLAARPWLLAEVDALLQSPDLTEAVRLNDFEEAQETLKLLTIALDNEVIAPLYLLVDKVPRIARSLDALQADGEMSAATGSAARWIETMEDLMLVDRLLSQLGTHVRS